MLTGEIRNKVDKIWTDIWAGGITNPLTVIEQLTYLMFIRSLDEKELEGESFEALTNESQPQIFPQDEDGQAMRWSKFKTIDSRRIYDIVGTKVFPFIKTMNGHSTSAFSRYMQDAMFLIPPPPRYCKKSSRAWMSCMNTILKTWTCRETSTSICWANWHKRVKTVSSERQSISAI